MKEFDTMKDLMEFWRVQQGVATQQTTCQNKASSNLDAQVFQPGASQGCSACLWSLLQDLGIVPAMVNSRGGDFPSLHEPQLRIALLRVQIMQIQPKTYSLILYDKRISNGAFRLWHYLRDRLGNNACAWPSTRTIAADLNCGKGSVSVWIEELVNAGYLTVKRGNERATSRYYLVAMGVPENGRCVPPNGRCVPVAGTELNSENYNPKKGSPLPPYVLISIERKLVKYEKELTQLDYEDSPNKEQKDRKRFLKAEISRLEQQSHIEL